MAMQYVSKYEMQNMLGIGLSVTNNLNIIKPTTVLACKAVDAMKESISNINGLRNYFKVKRHFDFGCFFNRKHLTF